MHPRHGHFTAPSGLEINMFSRVSKLDSNRPLQAEHSVRHGGMKVPGRCLFSFEGKDAHAHIAGFKDYFIAIAHGVIPTLLTSAARQVGWHKLSSCIDVTHLAAEFETDPLEYHPADMGDQAQHVPGRGSAQVDDEIGVLR